MSAHASLTLLQKAKAGLSRQLCMAETASGRLGAAGGIVTSGHGVAHPFRSPVLACKWWSRTGDGTRAGVGQVQPPPAAGRRQRAVWATSGNGGVGQERQIVAEELHGHASGILARGPRDVGQLTVRRIR